MKKLSKSEEQIMEYIWQKDKVFMKDIIECFPEPKPAATTVATLLKRMTDKNVIGYVQLGNSRQYFSLIKKSDYFSNHVKNIIKNYFGDSAMQFASFFAKETKLTKKQLEELKEIIDSEIKKKNK